MIFSKDYVGYLARQTVKQLIADKMISTEKPLVLNERVTAGMIDELSLEDRINDEVRAILEAIQEDMRKGGVSYPEMFKKVKLKLARTSIRRCYEDLARQAEQAGSYGCRHTGGDCRSATSWRTGTRSARRRVRRSRSC